MIGSLEVSAALLLAGAGLAKLFAPHHAAAMLRRMSSRPSTPERVVRVAGVVELVVAIAVVTQGGRAAALALGCCYLVFAVVTVRLMRRGLRVPCGCFGRADSPVGSAHLVLDLAGAGVALGAALHPPGRLGALYAHGALAGTVGLAQSVLLAYLGFLSITALPALGAARRQLERS